jgi:glycosyltransferase involved in cell wall biosynthesis
MSRKKIGLVVYANPDHYPPTVNAVHLLAQHFDVVLIGRNQGICDRTYPANVQVHRLGQPSSVEEKFALSMPAKIREYIDFIVQTRRLLKDVALIYAYDSFAFSIARICQQFLPQKPALVYHNHEIFDNLFPLTSLTGWVERAEKLWINQADLTVFPDQDRAIFYQKRTPLISSPLIVPNFPLRSMFQLPEDWTTILQQRWETKTLFYRGSISDGSSMKEIVSAAALLPSAQVQFVGFLRSETQQVLFDWAQTEGLRDRVTYLGLLPYADVMGHTVAATIGFALYKNTGYDRVACASACNKIYEYAACGLPVIVSDFSTYRDYLAQESWVRFADPTDPRSLYRAIQEILSNFEQYQQLCLDARRAFEQKFNYETVFTPLLQNLTALSQGKPLDLNQSIPLEHPSHQ